MKKQQKNKRTSTGTGASVTIPMTPVFLCKSARGFRQVSVKQLNPTYGYDHRSDFLRCVSVIERLPCAKGAVSEAD